MCHTASDKCWGGVGGSLEMRLPGGLWLCFQLEQVSHTTKGQSMGSSHILTETIPTTSMSP